jgi:hypothetical protein
VHCRKESVSCCQNLRMYWGHIMSFAVSGINVHGYIFILKGQVQNLIFFEKWHSTRYMGPFFFLSPPPPKWNNAVGTIPGYALTVSHDDITGTGKQHEYGHFPSWPYSYIIFTAAIFWSVVHPHMSSNHSWFIHHCSLVAAETSSGKECCTGRLILCTVTFELSIPPPTLSQAEMEVFTQWAEAR